MIKLPIENKHEGTTDTPSSYTFIVFKSPSHYVTNDPSIYVISTIYWPYSLHHEIILFSRAPRPAVGPKQPRSEKLSSLFPWGRRAGGVGTTHLHLVSRIGVWKTVIYSSVLLRDVQRDNLTMST